MIAKVPQAGSKLKIYEAGISRSGGTEVHMRTEGKLGRKTSLGCFTPA